MAFLLSWFLGGVLLVRAVAAPVAVVGAAAAVGVAGRASAAAVAVVGSREARVEVCVVLVAGDVHGCDFVEAVEERVDAFGAGLGEARAAVDGFGDAFVVAVDDQVR